jgi:hypothetical protein
LLEKENIWMWSGNTIVWVVSLRQGEQFRVDSNTKHIKNRVRIMKLLVVFITFLAFANVNANP